MSTLGVILARAGSKGLPDKCVLPLCGKPVIAYSLDHARQAERLDAVVLTTDSAVAAEIGRKSGIKVIDRPAELASDDVPVVAAVRHAVETWEEGTGQRCEAVVILYGNVPVRAEGVIDRCIEHLERTGCDSVRTVAPVSKQHPDWLHRLDGDRMQQYRANSIDRRQDLDVLYYHDGAVVAFRRDNLFTDASYTDPHAFFGRDRRAVVQREEDTVDIDTQADFYRAEAVLRARAALAGQSIAGAAM